MSESLPTTGPVTLDQFIEAAVKVGAGEERERIVAWLRQQADPDLGLVTEREHQIWMTAAFQIERGEHEP